jgi:hypothetical protein
MRAAHSAACISIDPFPYSFVLFELSAKLWPFREKGGRGVGAISITVEYRRRLDIVDGRKVPVWFAPDEGRPLLAFAGGSVRNAGSAITI